MSAASWLAEHDAPAGPYNICCPVTPRLREFVTALAAHLHRPAPFVLPPALLKLVLGPLGPEVTNSTNLRPAALLREGYTFQDADVDHVVATALHP